MFPQRAYTLVVDVVTVEGQRVERVMHSGIILPGADWHTLVHSGLTGKTLPCICIDRFEALNNTEERGDETHKKYTKLILCSESH